MRFGFGGQSFLAIDPGRHTLKLGVGQIGPKGKWARLHSVYTVRTGATPDTTADDLIDRTGKLIQEVIKRHSISAKQVSFAIPGRASFVRQLRIPRVSGDKLERLIQYEARQQIPFPLEDIILDSHVFDGDDPELGVTLVAIRRTIIDQFCTILRSAGLVPDTIDVGTLSLFNAFYPQLKEDPEDMVALVDIGASTTDIVVCRRGRVQFIRPAPQAGDYLTKTLGDQMGLEWEQAEELKTTLGELDPSIDRQTDPLTFGEEDQAARVRVFLSKTFDAVANEIRRTLDFYVSQPEGEPIGKIYLTGGTARCPGIDDFIQKRLGIPCEVTSPFDGALVDVKSLEVEPLKTTSSVLIGQCQRGIADVPLRMNFLPHTIVRQKEFEKRRAVLFAEGVLLTFLIGFSVFTMGQDINYFQTATMNLEDNISGEKKVPKQIRHSIKETQKLEERVASLREIGRSRGVVCQTLAEIADKIPLGDTWITDVEGDTSGLLLKLRGKDEISVGKFTSHMKEVTRLRGLQVKDLEHTPGGGVSFSLEAGVVKVPSLELAKLREKLETREVFFFDVNLDRSSKNTALIQIDVENPYDEAERTDLVMSILHSLADADLGFSNREVDIVFQNERRQVTGSYTILEKDIQALLQGKKDVSHLTLKPS